MKTTNAANGTVITDFTYHISLRGGAGIHITEATVKFKADGLEFYEVSEGNGPIHAMDLAIRKGLEKVPHFKQRISGLHLADYNVSLNNARAGAGSAAETKVLITFEHDGKRGEMRDQGLNVIESSISALLGGFERVLAG